MRPFAAAQGPIFLSLKQTICFSAAVDQLMTFDLGALTGSFGLEICHSPKSGTCRKSQLPCLAPNRKRELGSSYLGVFGESERVFHVDAEIADRVSILLCPSRIWTARRFPVTL